MNRRWRYFRPRRAVTVGLLLIALLFPGSAASDAPRFAGRSLVEALRALQAEGLRIVFSSELVPAELEVVTEPEPSDAREILDDLLLPHGLTVREGPEGVLIVVKRPVGTAEEEGSTALVYPSSESSIPLIMDELTVVPSRISLFREDPAAPFSLSRDEIAALPHLGNDFFRALSLLPGVSANDISAQFHVRGARRDETQVLLDGQELFASYHLVDFDSALSVITSDVVESVDLTSGGFPVEYGDRMSGVLDMTTLRPTGDPRIRLALSVLNAQAGAFGTFRQGRGSWIVQGRRGSTDLVEPLLDSESPTYWDVFGKLEYQFSDDQSLRINALVTDDRFQLEEDIDGDRKRIRTAYDNAYAWITHSAVPWRNVHLSTALSRSRSDRDRRGSELEEDARFVVIDLRELDVLSLRQQWAIAATTRHLVSAGFELRRFKTSFDYLAEEEFDNDLADIREPGSDLPRTFQERFVEHHDSAHLADRVKLGDALTVEFGLRYDRHSQTRERVFSPRANLGWVVTKSGVVRLAWGQFSQSQRPYELQVEDGDTVFYPVEKAEHRVVGWEQILPRWGRSSGLVLRAEVFQRRVDNPRPRYENLFEPFNNFPEVEPDRVRIAPESSLAEGIEVFLRGEWSQSTRWWANYTYSVTEDRIAGEWVPRLYDQTHALNLDLDHQFGLAWTLNLAWRYHTGWPTSPIGLQAVADDEGETVFEPVLGPVNSERLSPYHRLDLRVSRHWRREKFDFTVFADVQNAYNRKNQAGFDIGIDAEAGELVVLEEEWAGILPSLGIAIEF